MYSFLFCFTLLKQKAKNARFQPGLLHGVRRFVAGGFSFHAAGEGLAPPTGFRKAFMLRGGFALWGDLLCPRRQRRQNAAGGVPRSPPGSSGATPGPPFTGVIPTPFHRSSGAQNTVPCFNSSRAAGPCCSAKFRFFPVPRRAWFRPAVAGDAGSCLCRMEPFP